MIRLATNLDIEDIASLEEKCFKEPLSFEFLANDISNNPLAKYLVFEVDKKVIGYIGCWVDEYSQILNFCVDESYRRQGIANKLLSELLGLCSNSKCVSLDVRESNIAAQSLYIKHGFIKGFKRLNYYSDNENAVVMVKEV